MHGPEAKVRSHSPVTSPVLPKKTAAEKITGIIAQLEGLDVPYHYYIMTFLAAISLRNVMEIMVAQNVTRIFWYTALHYSLFYASLLLNIILLLHFMSGEKVGAVSKIVMAGFIVTATVPITDVLLQLVWRYDITYLYMVPEKTRSIWRNYLLFFGEHKGATPGMRVEIFTVMVCSAIYVYLKTHSKIRAALTALLIYSLIFWLYGAIIYLILGAEKLFGLPFDTSFGMMIDVYLFLVLHSLLLVFIMFRPAYAKALLRDFRTTRIVHYELMMLVGIAIGYPPAIGFSQRLSTFMELYFAAAAIVFACVYSTITNNLADIGIDRISNPDRPSVTAAIPHRTYERIGHICLSLAVLYALAAGYQTLFLLACFIGNYFLYSMPPLRLKRVPVLSKFLIALNCLLMMLVGYAFVGRQIPLFPTATSTFVLVVFTACINFIDIKDYQGDKAEGIKTLPVLLGLPWSKRLIGLFLLTGYALVPYFLDMPDLYVPALTSGALIFFLVVRKKYTEWPVFTVYLASVIYFLIYVTAKHNLQ